MAPQIKVLGGDFDTGVAWIYPNEGFVFRENKQPLKPISFDRAREFEEATEASLERLGLRRLLQNLKAAQMSGPTSIAGPDIVLCFDDDKAVLIRADKNARQMIGEKVQHGYTAPPPPDGDDPDDQVSES
jgi:hypothetical protein